MYETTSKTGLDDTALAVAGAAVLCSAMAEEIQGVPGSPGATTTISGSNSPRLTRSSVA